jgi:hypothetical protein
MRYRAEMEINEESESEEYSDEWITKTSSDEDIQGSGT